MIPAPERLQLRAGKAPLNKPHILEKRQRLVTKARKEEVTDLLRTRNSGEWLGGT